MKSSLEPGESMQTSFTMGSGQQIESVSQSFETSPEGWNGASRDRANELYSDYGPPFTLCDM